MESRIITNNEFFSLVEQELQENGHVRFRVKGTSMQPMLRNGRDEVLLKARGNREPKVGDICLFRFNGSHILHRCIRIQGPVFYMRGDNILHKEEHCGIDGVLGMVEKIYRDEVIYLPDDPMWKIRTRIHRRKLEVRFRLSQFKSRVGRVLRKIFGSRH